MAHRGEHAFDRVRGAQVVPVLGGKVEEIPLSTNHLGFLRFFSIETVLGAPSWYTKINNVAP